MAENGMSYKDAGVDIDAANASVERIKKWVNQTKRPEVIDEIGSFGGLFALPQAYREPVLVSGTDGVGTKLKIAQMMNKHDTVGIDLVAMCVNDILVHGAEPLFFLDYIAVGKLDPQRIEALVKGVSEGCLQAGCALIGGETAEMPGFYGVDEYDLAGFAVGAVEKSEVINGSHIQAGDTIIGLPSSGLHSNGFSLVRKVLLEKAGYSLDRYIAALGKTLGEELITPTRIYVSIIQKLLPEVPIHGMAHITGGGIPENLQRILPAGLGAVIDEQAWEKPPIFSLLQELGGVSKQDMYRTFNMGIGYIMVLAPDHLDKALKCLRFNEEKYIVLGKISQDIQGVDIR
ncbi:MAG TPA: phosphoribosylformylglycinamidine cyclo-ligase [Syntrophomonadaceae bacterium]|nr:phosphoribosylformylglycinamidine cyclo-ligase [Syntrophomonadaceae bacterium]